jgi:hypothetical protein
LEEKVDRREWKADMSYGSLVLPFFAQLSAALFCKLVLSHSATEQEGRAEPAGTKGDSASHRMPKGKRVRVEESESGDRREKDLAEGRDDRLEERVVEERKKEPL